MRKSLLAALFALFVLAILSAPHPAYACGGMFSPDQSIQQNAERIIFVNNGDGTHSAIMQI